MGGLEFKDVAGDEELLVCVRATYDAVFPPAEQVPFEYLLELAERPATHFVAVFDEGSYCGLALWLSGDDLSYLFYLGVDPKVQSKGYGSRILAHIKALHEGGRVFLEAESLEESDVDNRAQREARGRFYNKNGFERVGIKVFDDGVWYDVYSWPREVGLDELKDAYAELLPEYAADMAFERFAVSSHA